MLGRITVPDKFEYCSENKVTVVDLTLNFVHCLDTAKAMGVSSTGDSGMRCSCAEPLNVRGFRGLGHHGDVSLSNC